MPGEWRRLRHLIREFAPDLVHLHSAKAGLAGRLAVRGSLPTVYQPHAWSFLAAGGPVGHAALSWERIATRWTDAIVCVSREERAQGEAAGVKGHMRVIPNGVDLGRFQVGDRSQARRELGVGPEPLVVCVGRLSRQKGQDVLLEAWGVVSAALPEARLVLVGGGPDEQMLRAAAPAGVVFAGVSSQVAAWLAAANVVVLPSRWEGMSLSMLEAMAAGRSLVATDVAGAREALEGGGGVVVPVEDAPALSTALLERLEAPETADAEGSEARAVAQARFGLDRTLRETVAVYEDVLERRAP